MCVCVSVWGGGAVKQRSEVIVEAVLQLCLAGNISDSFHPICSING